MWSIICFNDENSVEIVPTFWYNNNNGLCAWPKKNVKQFVTRRMNPNEIDFNYFKARTISKDIGKLIVFIFIILFFALIKFQELYKKHVLN